MSQKFLLSMTLNYLLKKYIAHNYVKFQLDTDAQCNIILLHVYVKATGDKSLNCLDLSGSSIVSYGGLKTPIVDLMLLSLVEMSGVQ